jgi:hypothetical protein
MLDWAVPWTTAEIIDAIFLVTATAIISAVPLVYAFRANLRDPLALAILAGTGATALVFAVSLTATVAFHAGWDPSESTTHWLARGLYTTVALGKLMLLLALIHVLRKVPKRRISESVQEVEHERDASRF